MLESYYGVAEASWREATVREPHLAISESPRTVGIALRVVAAAGANGPHVVTAGIAGRHRHVPVRRSPRVRVAAAAADRAVAPPCV